MLMFINKDEANHQKLSEYIIKKRVQTALFMNY